MLEAGTPAAIASFKTIELNNVYHAVMGVCLTWLATQFPTQYSLSAARHHQEQAIPILRQRLSERAYDEETHLSILCAMQTAVSSLEDFLAYLDGDRRS